MRWFPVESSALEPMASMCTSLALQPQHCVSASYRTTVGGEGGNAAGERQRQRDLALPAPTPQSAMLTNAAAPAFALLACL